MTDSHLSGKRSQFEDLEHIREPDAKRVSSFSFDGTTYFQTTGEQGSSGNNPIHVILAHPTTGLAYSATADGTSANVTSFVGGSFRSTNARYTAMTVTTAALLVLPARADRTGFSVDVASAAATAIYGGFDSSITSANGAREIEAGESWEGCSPQAYTGDVYVIAAAGSVACSVHEFWE